jgi:hypothetical protein
MGFTAILFDGTESAAGKQHEVWRTAGTNANLDDTPPIAPFRLSVPAIGAPAVRIPPVIAAAAIVAISVARVPPICGIARDAGRRPCGVPFPFLARTPHFLSGAL